MVAIAETKQNLLSRRDDDPYWHTFFNNYTQRLPGGYLRRIIKQQGNLDIRIRDIYEAHRFESTGHSDLFLELTWKKFFDLIDRTGEENGFTVDRALELQQWVQHFKTPQDHANRIDRFAMEFLETFFDLLSQGFSITDLIE